MRPYEDIRLVDLSFGLGNYAARLFADLGAEVILVEDPERRAREDSPLVSGCDGDQEVAFEFLNVNKTSVAIARDTPAGRAALRELAASAAVVIYERDRHVDELLPLLVDAPGDRVVTTVSPFGLTGPYSDYLGSDLVAQATGGLAWLTGTPDRPPLRLAGQQSLFVTSLYAAAATAVALWDVERNGGCHLLDVSAQECFAHSLQNATQVYDLEGRVSGRGGEGRRDATESLYACKDGYVFLAAPLQLPQTWNALVDWMAESRVPGHDSLRGPEWNDHSQRTSAALYEQFRQIFERFAADKTKDELREAALARKIILAPVNSIAETLDDPQLVYRQFFKTYRDAPRGRDIAVPGAPYMLSEPVWSVDRPLVSAEGRELEQLLGSRRPSPTKAAT